MKKIVIFLLVVVACLSLSSCHYTRMAFDAPIVKDSWINKLVLGSWYLCNIIMGFGVFLSFFERDPPWRNIRKNLYEVGAPLYGLWAGLALILLLIEHVLFPFLGSVDYNLLIKIVIFFLIGGGLVFLYIKFFSTKYSDLLWTMFAYLSQIVCIVDLIVTLWDVCQYLAAIK